ncbi:HEPN domain-containing protein [Oceanobacillus profundus]|uniref:HEPN domain-containing protein n=1 Tax=Oceanobacillus profundus TaxID=372463 RepID=UPI00203B7008|nr:HEPN domain-containing protein [Oceanobacillus profundus]MCM3398208.1 HEPN domain-containing protein [Oceanobacillus profundus]
MEASKSLKYYLNEIQYLRSVSNDFLKDADSVPEFDIKNILVSKLKNHRDTRFKQFEYSSIIISMYGNLERYIEDVLAEVLDVYSKNIKAYNDLPEVIQDNHFKLSAELIKNLDLPKYINKVSVNSIIANMNSCLDNDKYKINIEAFTHHTANFRIETIDNYFSNIGIKGIKVSVQEDIYFKKYCVSIDEEVTSFSILKELTNRRNEIAHGAENIEILDLSILNDYIEYIDQLVLAINTSLIIKMIILLSDDMNLLKLKLLSEKGPIVFGSSVRGCFVKNKKLKKGMKILLKNRSEYSIAKIENIRIEEKDVEEYEFKENLTEASIKFDRNLKEQTQIFILPSENSDSFEQLNKYEGTNTSVLV